MKKSYTILIVLSLIIALMFVPISASATMVQTQTALQRTLQTDKFVLPQWIKMLPEFEITPEDIKPIRKYEEIPLYNQLDYPHIPFSTDNVAESGCGITCMAMVATYLLDEEHLPDELALAYNPVGVSNAERMETAARGLGIEYSKVYTWVDSVELLKDGKILIALVHTPSIFTSGGHFIVLKGITEEGKILVNDPNGRNYGRYPDEFESGFEQWQIINGYSGAWVFG